MQLYSPAGHVDFRLIRSHPWQTAWLQCLRVSHHMWQWPKHNLHFCNGRRRNIALVRRGDSTQALWTAHSTSDRSSTSTMRVFISYRQNCQADRFWRARGTRNQHKQTLFFLVRVSRSRQSRTHTHTHTSDWLHFANAHSLTYYIVGALTNAR